MFTGQYCNACEQTLQKRLSKMDHKIIQCDSELSGAMFYDMLLEFMDHNMTEGG